MNTLTNKQYQAIHAILHGHPIEKTGISTSLVYEWMKNHSEFINEYQRQIRQQFTLPDQ